MHPNYLNRVLVSLAGSFPLVVFFAPTCCRGYVFSMTELWTRSLKDEDVTSSTPTMPIATLAARDSTGDLVHDQFFIPAIVSIGVIFLLGVFCICMLVTRKPSRPILPPNAPRIVSDMRPHTLRPVSMQQHPSQTHNDVEIYDSQGRPQSRVQRKPPPAFLASPNRTPPGTATMGNFPSPSHPPSASGGVGGAYTHLRPGIAGVPQHPSLQKYNPEPLAYTARNVDQNTESVYRPPGRWARRDLPVSTPSTDDISSITHLGSGGSDYHQQQQQHHQQGLGPSANTSQSPLSPLPGSTPPQQHQSQKHPYQHRHQQSTSSREGEVHTHPADITGDSDYANAYGGIEDKANASENAATAAANRDQRPRQPLPPPPPEYTDSSGGLSYLTTPALSAHKVPTSQ